MSTPDEILDLYKTQFAAVVEACAFMHDEREELGIGLGQRITVEGVTALRKQRDLLRLQRDGWRGLVEKTITILQEQIVPDGITEEKCINRLLLLLDGPEYRAVSDLERKKP